MDKRINKRINERINKRISELIAGILASGVFIQIIYGIVVYFYRQFWSGRFSFTRGLWIGVAISVLQALFTYRSIDRALRMEQDEAERYMRRVYAARTLLFIAAAGIVWYTKIGYVMSAFLGMLCLEFGAILQPIVHKIMAPRSK